MIKSQSYYQSNRIGVTGFLPNNYSRVLEIGCADGSFAKYLRLKPCEIWGVEPNQSAADLARDKIDHVLTGTYDDVADQIPDNYFDLVVCNDVIEHMQDHDRFLEIVKNKMKNGSYLVGSIPNIRHITSLFKLLLLKDWPYSPSGILDRTHLRFFTAKSLQRTLTEHGYQIEEFAGLNSIIKNGIIKSVNQPSWLNDSIIRSVAVIVVLLTFGYYHDTQYPQFGFQAILSKE